MTVSAAPFEPQNPREIGHLVTQLTAHQKKDGFKGNFQCKKATFAVEGSHILVDSWKMMEQEYKKPNLPTYARGLFTCLNSRKEQEIATRGYDKFFNYNETRMTEWRNLESNTAGPYQLSVKENGCIIFMSGLEDDNLLICSKHSTGPITGGGLSHSQVGKQWVARHLALVGKSEQDLARRLRDMNATAVAELCDDEFEEHVLAYTPDQAGLYLHGINLNLPHFVTHSVDQVDAFALEWGFKKVNHIEMPDIHAVKAFCEEVAQTGNYDGRDTEGFVIRCKARQDSRKEMGDWFFKYKFEEPYLMYRQWRECTRAVIAGRVPVYKKHKEITAEYIDFARRKLQGDPALRAAFNQNHGIIKLRDDFLAARGTTGAEIIRSQTESQEQVKGNIVLVPVATIGCGKTTVALALTELFGWGHIQNDNIEGKQRPARFAHAVCTLLQDHNVVVADRNNHQRRERKQLIEDVAKVVPNARFVALNYVHDDLDSVREQTRTRVLSRGDNHQTIQAVTKGQEEIIGIMEGFIHRFEPLNAEQDPDTDFDLVINLDPSASSQDNLETVINKLNSTYTSLLPAVPSSDDTGVAITRALDDYRPGLKHDVGGSKKGNNKHSKDKKGRSDKHDRNAQADRKDGKPSKQREPKTEYFAATLPADRVLSIVELVFRDEPADVSAMYNALKQNGRLQSAFHVTLIHRASASQHQDYWNELNDVHYKVSREQSITAAQEGDTTRYNPQALVPELGICKVHLERVVWDSRVMCVVVHLDAGPDSPVAWRSVNTMAHITIGTADPSIKPKESNDLLHMWRSDLVMTEHGSVIRNLPVRGRVELMGSVKAVPQKF